VELGWNILTGADRERIIETVYMKMPPPPRGGREGWG